MLGRGIMRGRTIWLCPFKANASGQLLVGTECKREMGKTWLIETASAQGSGLLPRADLSAVKHLLTLRPVQRDRAQELSRPNRSGGLGGGHAVVPGVCKARVGQAPHSPGPQGFSSLWAQAGCFGHPEASISLCLCSNLVAMASFKTNERGRSGQGFI